MTQFLGKLGKDRVKLRGKMKKDYKVWNIPGD